MTYQYWTLLSYTFIYPGMCNRYAHHVINISLHKINTLLSLLYQRCAMVEIKIAQCIMIKTVHTQRNVALFRSSLNEGFIYNFTKTKWIVENADRTGSVDQRH